MAVCGDPASAGEPAVSTPPLQFSSATGGQRVGDRATSDWIRNFTNELGKNRTDRAERTYPKIAANPAAIVVKLADRIANTEFSRDAGSSMWRKYVAEYPKFRHWLYQFWQFESYPEMSVLWDRLDQANPEMSLLWDRSVESTAGRGWLL